MNKVTVKDLAKVSGYSQPTVSRALNDSELISIEAKQKIKELARRMNYRPNIAARSLAGQKTGIIGFYIYQMDHAMHPTLSQVLQGVTKIVAKEGYNLLLILADGENINVDTLSQNYIDGLLIPTQETPDDDLVALEQQNTPYVLINRDDRTGNRYTASIDYKRVSYEITEYLYLQGHRRIAFLSGPEDFWISRTMLAGYREASEKYLSGVQLVRFGTFSEKDGYSLASSLLELPEPPTAFFGEDFMIAGALRTIKERGLSVPNDVALVGINDVPLIASLEPPISSMKLPMEQLGERAASILLQMLNGKKPNRKIMLPGELIIRKSS